MTLEQLQHELSVRDVWFEANAGGDVEDAALAIRREGFTGNRG